MMAGVNTRLEDLAMVINILMLILMLMLMFMLMLMNTRLEDQDLDVDIVEDGVDNKNYHDER